MPRHSRIVFPGIPHHITQRGNRRADVFFTDADRTFYLEQLQEYCERYDVDILAYCLMTNHIHLKRVEETIKPFRHIHVTFTIPKLLRAYFRRNRKLLRFLPQSANYAVNEYFHKSLGIEGGMSGVIYYIQTYGSFYNYHPHVHALVCSGVEKDGVFYQDKRVSGKIIGELFKNRLLNVLVDEYVITEEVRELLLS